MNPADTFAPIALHVLLGFGALLLAAELVGAWRRRRRARRMARRRAYLQASGYRTNQRSHVRLVGGYTSSNRDVTELRQPPAGPAPGTPHQ